MREVHEPHADVGLVGRLGVTLIDDEDAAAVELELALGLLERGTGGVSEHAWVGSRAHVTVRQWLQGWCGQRHRSSPQS